MRSGRRDAGATKCKETAARNDAGQRPAVQNALGKDFDPRPVEQPGSFGIVLNVLGDFSKRGLTSNQVIEILALPKRTRPAKKSVCLVSGIGLPGMQDAIETMLSQRGNQHMYVIGHDAPCQQAIAPAMKVAESLGGNAGDARVAQVTTANPAIETSFDPFQ